jgi:ATP-binding cassette subfamily C protein
MILLLLFARVMPKLRACHENYRDVVNQLPAFEAIAAMERRCAAAAEPPAAPGGAIRLEREIVLADVSFAYAADRAPALNRVNLAIPAGRVSALAGASGSGKSTVADIVMGLLVPDSGTVRIGSEVLRPGQVRAWRSQIGYVGSDTFLFHDTVRNNLLWARPGATEAAMREALELAAATEFIAAMPDGLDTVVGDRGALVSQGERQRLALARALLRNPALLVLDEATNSLDPENESRILSALDRLRGDLTVLLIAHRLSTIRWADIVHVMDSGRVVESGGPVELNRRPDSRFRALCDAHTVTV